MSNGINFIITKIPKLIKNTRKLVLLEYRIIGVFGIIGGGGGGGLETFPKFNNRGGGIMEGGVK